jgi:heterodisulfide reductase subunit B
MRTFYYPGCTLPDKARDFDTSARTTCDLLGIELEEMERWVCCGSAFKLDRTNVMQHLAPIRNLAEVHKEGGRLMTLCVFCYNSLKRANYAFNAASDRQEILNDFIESDYDGKVQVVHLLEMLKDDVSFEALAEQVKRPLTGLKVAVFYGCLLMRPFKEVGFEDPENPSVLERLFEALGAEVVPYPHHLECCGSYLSLKDPEHTTTCVTKILGSAVAEGANAIVTSCPMCNFNFEFFGGDLVSRNQIHTFYFTELLALALGADKELCGLEQHETDVDGFLQDLFAGRAATEPVAPEPATEEPPAEEPEAAAPEAPERPAAKEVPAEKEGVAGERDPSE